MGAPFAVGAPSLSGGVFLLWKKVRVIKEISLAFKIDYPSSKPDNPLSYRATGIEEADFRAAI